VCRWRCGGDDDDDIIIIIATIIVIVVIFVITIIIIRITMQPVPVHGCSCSNVVEQPQRRVVQWLLRAHEQSGATYMPSTQAQ
jgi:hypothetical protein